VSVLCNVDGQTQTLNSALLVFRLVVCSAITQFLCFVYFLLSVSLISVCETSVQAFQEES